MFRTVSTTYSTASHLAWIGRMSWMRIIAVGYRVAKARNSILYRGPVLIEGDLSHRRLTKANTTVRAAEHR